MPIYEYCCLACSHHFEVLQKMSDAPISHCPQCNQDKVERLVSAAGFELKGTGWYATDFKSKPASATQKATESTAPATSCADTAACQTACATKTEKVG